MPIDARIPMSGDRPASIDVMGSLSRIAQMKRMEAISQQEQRVAAQQERAAQEDEAFRQIIAESPDIEAATPKLLALNPERAQKFLQAHGQLQKTSAETSAFTRAQQEDEQFRTVVQESGGDLNTVIPKLMAINPKRTLEFIKLQHEAQTKLEKVEYSEGDQMKIGFADPYAGTVTPTGLTAGGQVAADRQAKTEARQASSDAARLGLERQRVGLEGQRVKLAQQQASGSESGGKVTGSDAELVAAILANPVIYDGLTPTAKTKLAGPLAKAGF